MRRSSHSPRPAWLFLEWRVRACVLMRKKGSKDACERNHSMRGHKRMRHISLLTFLPRAHFARRQACGTKCACGQECLAKCAEGAERPGVRHQVSARMALAFQVSQIKDDQIFSSRVARNGAIGMERTFCCLIITEGPEDSEACRPLLPKAGDVWWWGRRRKRADPNHSIARSSALATRSPEDNAERAPGLPRPTWSIICYRWRSPLALSVAQARLDQNAAGLSPSRPLISDIRDLEKWAACGVSWRSWSAGCC